MKIIDTNIFSKFLGGELVIDISGDVYTTEDLRNEIAILRSQFSSNWAKLGIVKFIEITD